MVTTFFTIFASLFSMVDPFAAMPFFAVMTSKDTKEQSNNTARKTTLYFVSILVLFYFVGTGIMSFFGISLEAMRIAGGLIIFSSGVQLMRSEVKASVPKEGLNGHSEDISLTPLAMPMLSGPGAISMLIGYHEQQTMWVGHVITVLAILSVGAATYLMLRSSPYIVKVLGDGGINTISKILGFFVMAIGVQFVINGIKPLFG